MKSGSELQEAPQVTPRAKSTVQEPVAKPGGANWRALATLPVIIGAAIALHLAISGKEPRLETETYTLFLSALLGLSILGSIGQLVVQGVRRWMEENYPLLGMAIILLAAAEIMTTGLRLLPLPYFPSPARILQSAIEDRAMIWDSTWHSLLLLISGYSLGVLMGLISGVCIGWFAAARYWGMPLVKVLGPIPATAWIPLALVLSPSAKFSAVGLIAIAVWFPVTMLTSSGISNTRASYLDVARTLGAGRGFLIFRVAIPAAMPNIFIGLFMGLGAAFLTLVVAETVGVKSGLGWYLGWAKEWAEYGKVYAALVIMAVFFSTIMTTLFKVRDRVLVWQKGTIKW